MYGHFTQDKISQEYDELSHNYDSLLVDIVGYLDPEQISTVIQEMNLIQNSKVLDIGCGTGLLGKNLKNLGFNEVHGIDASNGMLSRA